MTLNDRIKQFLNEISTDPVEERVVEYVVREVHTGRTITEVINDPYVRNRVPEGKLDAVLENPEVLDALDAEIRSGFSAPDIDFSS
ncbi:MAG: hypothetical protein HGA39_00385 [Coriobacteriia bacterium]|nr:hypothetical protein [Coriobacteriia bacterium]